MQGFADLITVSHNQIPSTRVMYANLRSDKNRLPPWRYALRQWLISYIRLETPYLAKLQEAVRRPELDAYFAITANLGTHTFFMIVLPIIFWCGYTHLARAYE